jgi:hypothetical protein
MQSRRIIMLEIELEKKIREIISKKVIKDNKNFLALNYLAKSTVMMRKNLLNI